MTFLDHTQLDTPQAVGLLWTSDQPDAEPSTCQHITLIKERHIYALAGFEPTILEGERPLNEASNHAAPGIGDVVVLNIIKKGFRVMSPSHPKITVNKDS